MAFNRSGRSNVSTATVPSLSNRTFIVSAISRIPRHSSLVTRHSNGIPGKHVGGAIEREKRALQCRQHVFGAGIRRPALGAVDAAHRARLAHQEDLVLARRE